MYTDFETRDEARPELAEEMESWVCGKGVPGVGGMERAMGETDRTKQLCLRRSRGEEV